VTLANVAPRLALWGKISVMESVYVSPDHPRAPLRSEEDVTRAVGNGLLVENHFLDLKRLIPEGKSKNVELAKDLASFAIDGGIIIVGIDERADGTLATHPVALDGLAERIDQIAYFGVDPPLSVVAERIRTEADPARGYLIVHVSPSPLAPHSVDGRYIARGDTTKRYLTDAEVMRFHERRIARRISGEDLVRKQFVRDPFLATQRQAHLFLVAEPQAASEELLVPFLDAGGWQQFAVQLLHSAIYDTSLNAQLQAARVTAFSPDMDTLQSFDLRAGGVALTSSGMARGRKLVDDPINNETLAELEIGNSGALRAYMSRLSDNIGDDNQQYVLDSAPVAYARRMIALAVHVSERAGYFGTWTVGVGATGLRGTHSWLHHESHMGYGPEYDEDEYVRSVEATYLEMRDRPGQTADRLVGPLLRTYRVRGAFAAALSDRERHPDG
jgi:hypothetical protein